jgi:FlaG protein
MSIAPLTGSPGLPAIASSPAEGARPAGRDAAVGVVPHAEPGVPVEGARPEDLRRLQTVASQAGLKVRFETLPQSNMTVIRLLDSQSGRVVMEFPPEGVARALADMEARATARTGHQTVDRRA